MNKKIVKSVENALLKIDLEPSRFLKLSQEIAAIVPWTTGVPAVIEEISNPVLRAKYRRLIPDLNYARVTYHLSLLNGTVNNDYSELEKGFFLVATLENPSLSWDVFQIHQKALAEKFPALDDDEKSRLLQFISVMKSTDWNSLDAYCTESRGLPLSRGVYFIITGQKAGLPLYGVNFPAHFLLHFDSPDFKTWIDPANNGAFLDKEECENFLERNGLVPHPDFFQGMSTLGILKRMLANMIHFHNSSGNQDFAKRLALQLDLLNRKTSRE